MRLKGAEILIRCLEEQGATYVFGYPGASVISVYDKMRNSSLTHILAAHEQGACFAAEGFARASGKAGIVLTTSGPGATNLVTGIADAYMDSVPLIAITGNVTLENLGHDSFQEVDIFDMTMPVTKYSMIVKKASEIAPSVRKAFGIAMSGRKGPVLIDIPSNVFDEYADYEKAPVCSTCSSVPQICDLGDIQAIADMINNAERPLIYAGGGVRASGAAPELKELAKRMHAPVLVSYMGIGCFDADDELYLGILSDSNQIAATALEKCDLIITVGARFNSRYKAFDKVKKSRTPLIQIDIDKAEIDKNLFTTAAISGDARLVLKQLNPFIKQRSENTNHKCAAASNKNTTSANEGMTDRDCAQNDSSHRGIDIIKALSRKLPRDSIVTTDVGLHQEWTAHNYKIHTPDGFITSGGLGAMGFGLGAAIGAHFATGKRCLLVTGDGSFNMNMNELSTAVRHGIPLVVAVMNNGSLGMIRKLQSKKGKNHIFASTLSPVTDYAALARAMGARGLTVNENDDIDAAIDRALEGTLPVVMDFRINIDAGIVP